MIRIIENDWLKFDTNFRIALHGDKYLLCEII